MSLLWDLNRFHTFLWCSIAAMNKHMATGSVLNNYFFCFRRNKIRSNFKDWKKKYSLVFSFYRKFKFCFFINKVSNIIWFLWCYIKVRSFAEAQRCFMFSWTCPLVLIFSWLRKCGLDFLLFSCYSRIHFVEDFFNIF